MHAMPTRRPHPAVVGDAHGGRRAACGVMTVAGVGLVMAALLGAPLVSILLGGLLLLCPLLVWTPFAMGERPRHHAARDGRGR
jgi:hypothetical protein